MTTIWAIADLHLSFARPRDFTRFGEKWRDHEARIAAAWAERVGPEDIILLPGDLSWAKRLDRAQPDLDWVSRLPGRKVLVRGNHDWWWKDLDQVREILPDGFQAVQGSCLELDGALICGTMGHIAPNDPYFQKRKLPSYQRELGWLKDALTSAATQHSNGQPTVLMMHYPPFTSDGQPSGFSEMIAAFAPEVCVYGHLHMDYEWETAVDACRDRTRFHLVAADYLAMTPRRVWPPE